MDTAGLLTAALKRANIPIEGVSIGSDGDRRTWRVDFAGVATPQERAAAAAIVAAFDANSPQVVDATRTGEATELATSTTIRAFYLWWFRKTNKRDPTPEEHAADRADLIQAYKDIASS